MPAVDVQTDVPGTQAHEPARIGGGQKFGSGVFVVMLAMMMSAVVAALVAAAAVSNTYEEGSASSSTRTSPILPLSREAPATVRRRLESPTGAPSAADAVGEEQVGEPPCLTTMEGELCHRMVLWAMDDGLRFHPERFQGLTRDSPLEAFQAVLHKQNPEYCPPPCGNMTAEPGSVSVMSAVGSRGSCDYGWGDRSPAHAGCFVTSNGRLLTVKLTYDGMHYDIPSGQTDWREPARCTAHREALEETGYRVAPRELLAVVRNNVHIYRCEMLDGRPIQGHDHEISWVGWMDKDEIHEKLRTGQWRFPEAAHYADWLR